MLVWDGLNCWCSFNVVDEWGNFCNFGGVFSGKIFLKPNFPPADHGDL